PNAKRTEIPLRRARAGYIWTAGAMGVAALAAVPIVSVLWAALAGGADGHIWRTTALGYAANTAALMAMVGVMAGTIGTGVAWLVTATDFPGRRTLSWLLVLPLAAPGYILAYLYTDLLSFSGPVQSALRATFGWEAGDYWFPEIRNLPGAALMLSLVLYPYVYLLARAAFAAQSRSQFQAARTLGLSPGRAFLKVVLPGARPAIAGGLALALMETLADFGVAEYFSIHTFSTGIFRTWLAMGDRLAAMQLAGAMLVFVIVLVGLEAVTRRGRVASTDRLSAGPPPFVLSPLSAALAFSACATPILFGFLAPMLVLIFYATTEGDTQSFATLWGYAQNSFVAAAVAAAIATALALLLAFSHRRASEGGKSGVWVKSGIRLATLGYALPGALLAVGLLGPLGAFDQTLTRFSRTTFGLDHGLLLTGSLTILVYALVVRFLTVSYNSVGGGMEKISPAMDDAARSLGARPFEVIRRIYAPLLRPSLAAGACLVFIDVMRELPATLILRPFNFETLATRVYRLASDERLAEASTAALLIVVAGALPVIALNRFRG
ncbi:MAG: iron ABC transporter permease, partial [Pseudomonadota bacterium]